MSTGEHAYLVGLTLIGRRVVVVGGGTVAQRRLPGLLAAGAEVEVIAPVVTPAVEGMATARELRWTPRTYRDGDLDGAWYALAATDDPQVNAAVGAEAERARAFCVRADDGPGQRRHPGRRGPRRADRRCARRAAVPGGPPRCARRSSRRCGRASCPPTRRRPVRPGVALVGGGPGDPELITVRGRRLLAARTSS